MKRSVETKEWPDCSTCQNERFIVKKYPENVETYEEVIGQKTVAISCPACNPNPPRLSYD